MEDKIKMAVIAGASHALKRKAKAPHTPDAEILRSISDNMDEIIEKIGASNP